MVFQGHKKPQMGTLPSNAQHATFVGWKAYTSHATNWETEAEVDASSWTVSNKGDVADPAFFHPFPIGSMYSIFTYMNGWLYISPTTC